MKIILAIPVYNEEAVLADKIQTLWDFCSKNLSADEVVIVIANNNSTDGTAQVAEKLSAANPAIKHLFIPQKGKGMAIASAWKNYEADIYGFMDADLSTDLSALPLAIGEIKKESDLVIASRFHKESIVERSLLRQIFSQGYRWFFKILFLMKLNDFPCGFKVANRKVRDMALEKISETGFFWDTEMLVLADKAGFKIKEIPITWRECHDPNRLSHVNILKTSLNYIKQSFRLRWRLLK